MPRSAGRADRSGGRAPPGGAAPALLLALLLGGCASRTPTVHLEPLDVPAPVAGPFGPVDFMTGCWRGLSGSGAVVIEERYTSSEGGMVLGSTRYLRDGRAVGFEFTLIHREDGVLVLTPHPGGERSEHGFRLTDHGPGRVTFEAPEHDFPKRIRYAREPGGGLTATVDGGPDDPSPRAWTMQPVDCS